MPTPAGRCPRRGELCYNIFSMDKQQKTELMRQIKDEVVALKESPLYTYRTEHNYLPVIGEGDHDAQIMFIGEAPGENEAQQGRPFCGAAGRILDELLEYVDIPRAEVYITNVVKDRPPDNRDPLPEEIQLYTPFLQRQMNIIQPEVIATLGRFSMEYIMSLSNLEEQLDKISKIHGQQFTAETEFGQVKIIPLYHPAVALYNPSTKKELQADFEKLKQYTA